MNNTIERRNVDQNTQGISSSVLQYCWPEKFTKRRKFDRNTESQPYIEYLETQLYDGEEEEDEDEDEEDADEEDADEDADEEGDDKNDISSEDDDSTNEPEDQGEGRQDTLGYQDEKRNSGKGTETCDRGSVFRRFMKGWIGDEDENQVDEVASFCETSPRNALNPKSVALLDDRNDGGIKFDKKGHYRPNLGPLTLQEFYEKLSKRRFRVDSDQTTTTNAFEDEENDAERRLVFIPDLDSLTIKAIITTAPLTQASPLRDLLYKHLTGKTSIGVTIPSQKLPFLSGPMDTVKPIDEDYCLYEAQISITVTGIDHWVWTAYGFVDNYFGSTETADSYYKLKGKLRGRADPISAGHLNGDEPIWTPREYFLTVVQIRIEKVLREWNLIVYTIENKIKWSRDNHEFPLAYNDPKTTAKVLDFSVWNTRMVALLSKLISGLSKTVRAWERFRGTEIGYFQNNGQISPSLNPSLIAISKCFDELKFNLWALEELKKELSEGSPQGLHAHLSFENNAAAIFQQRSAKKLEDLTVITIIFFPMALAANLFSAQGVLPFTSSFVKFIYGVLIIVALMVAILIVLSNWRFWLQTVVDYAQKLITRYNERQRGSEISCGTSVPLAKPSNLNIFARRALKADSWDIEQGQRKRRQAKL
ncbi:hypothetical protein G7Y89_g6081 [Cudoniella acicularis]|uniref:Uncharacterized protein n=1 Tax=Cudoniella acicularis TaxID=354080 RepID=A0A8H4RPH5_9HELO|nr:hypothetical protein G7Y89_g6081 [Cudoniella acicularis]